jgi:magnesium-transporting ATPase (P-type)
MPKVVDEGRRAINNVQQMAMLFLVKTFFILTLVFLTITGFFKKFSGDGSFPFTNPTQLLMIEIFVIGIPSVFLTIQPNKNRVSGHFLWNVLQKSLPGVVAIIFGVIVTYLLNYKCGFGVDLTKTIVVVTTTFIGLMILYLACKPFNWKKIALFVGMAACCAFLTSQAVFQKPLINLFGITNILKEQFDLQNVIITCVDASGNEVVNLTAVLLTLCLVALSFIIMSVCSYIISVINKIAIVKTINKSKQEVQAVDDVEEYIDRDSEY